MRISTILIVSFFAVFTGCNKKSPTLGSSTNVTSSPLVLTPEIVTKGPFEIVASVVVADNKGSPLSGIVVTFTADDATVTLTPSTTHTDSSGTASTDVVAKGPGQTTIHMLITPSDGSTPISIASVVTFLALPPDIQFSLLAATPSQVLADGQAVSTASVTVADSNGHALVGNAVTISVSGSNNTLVVPTPSVTGADGTLTATLASTTAETKSLSAAVTAGAAVFSLSSQVTFVPVVKSGAGGSSLSTTPSTFVAGDSNGSALLVTVVGGDGSPLSGQTVTFSSTPSTAVDIAQQNATSDANGNVSAVLTTKVAGTYAVSAVINAGAPDATTVGPTNVVVQPGAPDPLQSSISLSKASAIADGVDSLNVLGVVEDQFGNPIANEPLLLAVAGVQVNGIEFVPGTTASDGTFSFPVSAPFAASYTAGVAVAPTGSSSLTPSAFVLGPLSFQLVAGPVSAANCTLSVPQTGSFGSPLPSTNSIGAGVVVRDTSGNPVAGVAVQISVTQIAPVAPPNDFVFGQASATSTVAGSILGVLSSTSGDPLNVQHLVVSATLFPNTPQAAAIGTPIDVYFIGPEPAALALNSPGSASTVSGCFDVVYTVSQLTGQYVDMAFQYSLDSGTTWHTATQAGSTDRQGTTHLYASPTPIASRFYWNSYADVPTTTSGVQLRASAIIHSANGVVSAPTLATATFNVIQNAASKLCDPQPLAAPFLNSSYQGGPDISYAVAADSDGDGKRDVLYLNSGYVLALPGSGDGRFSTAVVSSTPVSGYVSSGPMAVSDFTGDGLDDVIYASEANSDSGLGAASIDIIAAGNPNASTGNGGTLHTFQQAFAHVDSPATAPLDLAVADVNGDGIPDVVALFPSGLAFYDIAGSGADGVFFQQTAMSTTIVSYAQPAVAGVSYFGYPTGQRWMALQDINGDGAADIAAIGTSTAQPGATLFLSNGSGGFASQTLQLPASDASDQVTGVAFGSLHDGDAYADIVVSAIVPPAGPGASSTGMLGVFHVSGDGTFTYPSTPSSVAYFPTSLNAVVAAPLVANASHQQIFTGSSGVVSESYVVTTDASGALPLGGGGAIDATQIQTYPYALAQAPLVYDFNADGYADLFFNGMTLLQQQVPGHALRAPANTPNGQQILNNVPAPLTVLSAGSLTNSVAQPLSIVAASSNGFSTFSLSVFAQPTANSFAPNTFDLDQSDLGAVTWSPANQPCRYPADCGGTNGGSNGGAPGGGPGGGPVGGPVGSNGGGIVAPGAENYPPGWVTDQLATAGAQVASTAFVNDFGNGHNGIVVLYASNQPQVGVYTWNAAGSTLSKIPPATVTPPVAPTTGDGTFYFLPSADGELYAPQNVVAADFDGDLVTDIVVTGSKYNGSQWQGEISFLHGNGDGTFAINGTNFDPSSNCPVSLIAPYDCTTWAAANFPDYAETDLLSASSQSASIVGAEAAKLTAAANKPTLFMTVGMASGNSAGAMSPYARASLSIGQASFGTAMTINPNGYFTDGGTIFGGPPKETLLAVADFNNDGNIDVVMNDQNGVTVYLGIGDGTFISAYQNGNLDDQNDAGQGVGCIQAQDFNGDGNADLLVGNDLLINTGSSSPYTPLFFDAGQYAIACSSTLSFPLLPSWVIADSDNDGKPDVIYPEAATNGAALPGRIVVVKGRCNSANGCSDQ